MHDEAWQVERLCFFCSYDFTPLDSSAVYVLSSMARQRRTSLSSGGAVSPDCDKLERSSSPLSSASKSNRGHTSGTASGATPTKCKRPMNAFMLFAKKYRVEYTQMYPGKDNRYARRHQVNCSDSRDQSTCLQGRIIWLISCQIVFRNKLEQLIRGGPNQELAHPSLGYSGLTHGHTSSYWVLVHLFSVFCGKSSSSVSYNPVSPKLYLILWPHQTVKKIPEEAVIARFPRDFHIK